MNAWDTLPTAQHIDWVLASLRQHPQLWAAAWDAARAAALDAALDAAWDAARAAARAAAWDAAWAAARDAAWAAAWAACAALVAYDYAGAVLGMPVDAVRLLASSGDPAATLLLPAVIVRNQS